MVRRPIVTPASPGIEKIRVALAEWLARRPFADDRFPFLLNLVSLPMGVAAREPEATASPRSGGASLGGIGQALHRHSDRWLEAESAIVFAAKRLSGRQGGGLASCRRRDCAVQRSPITEAIARDRNRATAIAPGRYRTPPSQLRLPDRSDSGSLREATRGGDSGAVLLGSVATIRPLGAAKGGALMPGGRGQRPVFQVFGAACR